MKDQQTGFTFGAGRKQMLLTDSTAYLKSAGISEPQISAEQLLAYVLGRTPVQIHLERDLNISDSETSRYFTLLEKRAAGYPLQYLLGSVSFRGHQLEIGEGCLIPRPETELLVEWALERLGKSEQELHLLDIGTGSGNIAVSLAKERPHWLIAGTDLSPKALEFARKNAKTHGVSEHVLFIECDLWRGSYQFDAVISNPPYLSKNDFLNVQKEVTFEPKMALDGGENGLSFYERIIPLGLELLKPGGTIFFEMGLGQAAGIEALLRANRFQSIQIKKDDAGIERFISGTLKHG